MKNVFGGIGAIVAVTVVLASACGGSDASPPPVTAEDGGADVETPDTSAADTSPTPTGECATNADCEAKLPATTPAGCAVATCDTLQKKCRFKAKDADGDGHLAKSCSAATLTIEAGDDCDDGDGNVYPGAWDGPATDVDSGPSAQADRCDQKDNDCNGSPDDGKIAVDGGDKTCKCDPNAPLPCYEYANGIPISASTLDANNNPKGLCKKGLRTCVNGIPGVCNGAVGPEAEVCDAQDHDCDGQTGNAGDTVAGAPSYCPDGDNDSYCTFTACVTTCAKPNGHRLQASCIGSTPDCNDGNANVKPGATEKCGDGVDSNCTGGDSETFGNLGASCVAGTTGVCRRTGTYVCNGLQNGTECNATPGTASTSGSTVASTDPLIDNSTATTGYDPHWDWNCNGTQELVDTLQGGSFRAAACGGDYESACNTFGTDSACNANVFTKYWTCRNDPPGFFISTTSPKLCGTNINSLTCLWQNASSKCSYVGNLKSDYTVACK